MTERIDIQNVLNQMRVLKEQVQPLRPDAGAMPVDSVNKLSDFGDLLKSAVNKVNETQKAAGALSTRFEQGDPSVDLPQVMIGLQKASVSFQAMTQVRNRLISAYEDIIKMPI